MKLLEFKPGHVDRIDLREFDALGPGMFADYSERLKAHTSLGPAFSLEHEGEIIAAAGVMLISPGVGEAWVLSGKLVEKYPMAFHRRVVRILNMIVQDFNLHRVQCSCFCEHEQSVEWLKRLGFEMEGRMRKCTPDRRDMFLLAKVM